MSKFKVGDRVYIVPALWNTHGKREASLRYKAGTVLEMGDGTADCRIHYEYIDILTDDQLAIWELDG